MKVPRDAENPSMHDVFKVSFWQFLTRRRHLRTEYLRRRQAARFNDLKVTHARIDEWADRKRAETEAKKAARRGRT